MVGLFQLKRIELRLDLGLRSLSFIFYKWIVIHGL